MPAGAPPNLKRGGDRAMPSSALVVVGASARAEPVAPIWCMVPISAVPYLSRRPSVLTCTTFRRGWMSAGNHAAQRVKRRTPVLFDLGLATMVITPGESVRKAAIERFPAASGAGGGGPEGRRAGCGRLQ